MECWDVGLAWYGTGTKVNILGRCRLSVGLGFGTRAKSGPTNTLFSPKELSEVRKGHQRDEEGVQTEL